MPHPPTPSRSPVSRVAGPLVALVALSSLAVSLLLVPPDAVQGQPQRLMYVHVPAAWVSYLAFLGVLVASIAYLRTRDPRWDVRARACAELGVGLTALTIVLGSLWGQATWGVWWTWDARLVTTALLFVVYVGYLGVRGLSADRDVNARRAALLGIVAFANVPLVHFSVLWWRTLHQPPTILSPDPHPPIAPVMLATLALGVLAFTLLGGWVVHRRIRALSVPRLDARPELRPLPGPAAQPTEEPLMVAPLEKAAS